MNNVSETITVCVTTRSGKSRILRLTQRRVQDIKEVILNDAILRPVFETQEISLKLNSKRFGKICELDEQDLVEDGADLIVEEVQIPFYFFSFRTSMNMLWKAQYRNCTMQEI